MYSVVILTLNEAQDLPDCLGSINGSDDIHLLDSGSVDETIPIAESFGARVTSHAFESFAKQRNWAMKNLPLKYNWIFFLDADERMTSDFSSAIDEVLVQADEGLVGFYCCWKMMLEDRWLKRSDNFPKWQLRLCRKGRVTFMDHGHGQKEGRISGKLDYIREPYTHFAFSKGWSAWLERHNRYADKEALVREDSNVRIRDAFTRVGSQRNIALKVILTKLPGWPLLRFLYTYFIRLGFIEGIPGFVYCVNMAYFEFLIKLKMRENRRKKDQECE